MAGNLFSKKFTFEFTVRAVEEGETERRVEVGSRERGSSSAGRSAVVHRSQSNSERLNENEMNDGTLGEEWDTTMDRARLVRFRGASKTQHTRQLNRLLEAVRKGLNRESVSALRSSVVLQFEKVGTGSFVCRLSSIWRSGQHFVCSKFKPCSIWRSGFSSFFYSVPSIAENISAFFVRLCRSVVQFAVVCWWRCEIGINSCSIVSYS